MIEHLKEFSDNAVAFVCRGHVTKGDDDTVLVPAVMQALKNHEKLRLYYETAADFFGIDPGAVWEDIKVGMEYFTAGNGWPSSPMSSGLNNSSRPSVS